jgi:hypothetical protein
MSKSLTNQQSLYSAAANRILPGTVALLVGLIIMFTSNGDLFILFLGALLLGLGGLFIWNGVQFIKGAMGDRKITSELLEFPEGWQLLNGLRILDAQIDYVLVCPKGIFIIETENYDGLIVGDGEDRHWQQHSGYNEISFSNPARQATEHSLQVSRLLKEHDIQCWVNTIVVFSRADVQLKVSNATLPVLKLADLQAYLNLLPEALDPAEGARIAEILASSPASASSGPEQKANEQPASDR